MNQLQAAPMEMAYCLCCANERFRDRLTPGLLSGKITEGRVIRDPKGL
jgi:hypothetical protein